MSESARADRSMPLKEVQAIRFQPNPRKPPVIWGRVKAGMGMEGEANRPEESPEAVDVSMAPAIVYHLFK